MTQDEIYKNTFLQEKVSDISAVETKIYNHIR